MQTGLELGSQILAHWMIYSKQEYPFFPPQMFVVFEKGFKMSLLKYCIMLLEASLWCLMSGGTVINCSLLSCIPK